jgi:hypothetical protein
VHLDPPADVFTQSGGRMQRGDAYRLFVAGRFDKKKPPTISLASA